MNYTRTKHTDVEIRSLAKQVFDDNLKQVFEKAQEQLNEFFNQVQVEFNKITDDINDIKRFLMPLVDQMSYCEMTITTDREDFKKDIAKIEKDVADLKYIIQIQEDVDMMYSTFSTMAEFISKLLENE